MLRNENRAVTRREFGTAVAGAAAGLAIGSTSFAAGRGRQPDIVAVTSGKGLSKVDASYVRMKKATDRFGGIGSFVKGKDVLIKVNAIDKKTGKGSTSIEAMQALVKLCKEAKAKSVSVISHDWGFDSKHLSGMTVRQGVKQAGARLYHMKDGPGAYKPIEVKDGGWGTVYVAKPVFQPNTVLINLPRLKTHPFTCYTGCIKNQMGLTCYMRGFHRSDDRGKKEPKWTGLPMKLAAAYDHIFRDLWTLHILDAHEPSFGWEGPPPERVRSFEARKTIVTHDPVAADVYAAGIMHELEPKLFAQPLGDWTKGDSPYAKSNRTKANYLVEFGKRGLGETDLGKLKIEEITV